MTPRKPTRRKQLGLSDEDYDSMLVAQGGGCAICGNPPKTRRLDTDHDHKTGKVRGLLCHRCNRALPTWVTVKWLYDAAAYVGGFAPGRDRRGLSQVVSAPQLCGRCLRVWGSVLVPPTMGFFSLLNTRTGTVHAKRRGRTACGLAISGEGWRAAS